MLAIKSYEVAYATLQALHTHGLDLHEEFDGGEIDFHSSSIECRGQEQLQF